MNPDGIFQRLNRELNTYHNCNAPLSMSQHQQDIAWIYVELVPCILGYYDLSPLSYLNTAEDLQVAHRNLHSDAPSYLFVRPQFMYFTQI